MLKSELISDSVKNNVNFRTAVIFLFSLRNLHEFWFGFYFSHCKAIQNNCHFFAIGEMRMINHSNERIDLKAPYVIEWIHADDLNFLIDSHNWKCSLSLSQSICKMSWPFRIKALPSMHFLFKKQNSINFCTKIIVSRKVHKINSV